MEFGDLAYNLPGTETFRAAPWPRSWPLQEKDAGQQRARPVRAVTQVLCIFGKGGKGRYLDWQVVPCAAVDLVCPGYSL